MHIAHCTLHSIRVSRCTALGARDGALDELEELAHDGLGGHRAVDEEQVVVLEAGVLEAARVVNLLVEAHDAADAVLAEVREVRLGRVQRVAVLDLTLRVRPAEREQARRHNPVEVAVLDALRTAPSTLYLYRHLTICLCLCLCLGLGLGFANARTSSAQAYEHSYSRRRRRRTSSYAAQLLYRVTDLHYDYALHTRSNARALASHRAIAIATGNE